MLVLDRAVRVAAPATLFSRLRRGVPLAVVAMLAALLLAGDLALLLRTILRDDFWRSSTDFGLYLNAAQAVADGGNPYDGGAIVGGVTHGYAYPPLLAELMVPLTWFNPDVVRSLWIAGGAASIIGAVVLLLRAFAWRTPWPYVALVLGVALASRTARIDLYHGQVNFTLLLFIVGGLYYTTRNRPILAGILWGATVVIKPFLAVLIVYLLWRRAWRQAAAAAATGITLFAISGAIALAVDSGMLGDWWRSSRYDASPPFTTQTDNMSLVAMLQRMFSAEINTSPLVDSALALNASSFALAAVLGVAWIVAMRYGRRLSELRQPELLLEAGFVVALGMTFGPLTEGDHLYLTLPGLAGAAMLAAQAWGTAGARRPVLALLAWLALFACVSSPVGQFLIVQSSMTAERPATLVEILWSGRVGFVLLTTTLLSAWALRSSHASSRQDGRTEQAPLVRTPASIRPDPVFVD